MLKSNKAIPTTPKKAKAFEQKFMRPDELAKRWGLSLSAVYQGKADVYLVRQIYFGKSLKEWLAELDDKDPLIREEAVEVVAQIGTAAKDAVPRLRVLVKDKNRSLRSRSALACGAMLRLRFRRRVRSVAQMRTSSAAALRRSRSTTFRARSSRSSISVPPTSRS